MPLVTHDRTVGIQPDEPAIQQVAIELLHQLALRTDAVKHLQQQRAQQLLGRDRGTASARMEPGKIAVHVTGNRPNHRAHRPKRMALSGWPLGTRSSGDRYENIRP